MIMIINILNNYRIERHAQNTEGNFDKDIYVMKFIDDFLISKLNMDKIPEINTTKTGNIYKYVKQFSPNTYSNKYLKYKAKYLALKKQLNL